MKNNTIISNEMIFFTGEKKRIMDFSGDESSLSYEKRLEYLTNYQKMARKWYNDFELDKKACSDQEVSEFLNKFSQVSETKFRKELHFDTMCAATAYKEPEYIGIHTYCGARVEDEEINFIYRNTRPTPCAKIELTTPKESFKLSMSIFIPSDYRCSKKKQKGTSQPGRTIEIRNKTLDIAKVKFFNTGEIFALSADKWEPTFTFLGNINFNEWNSLDITLSDTVSVSVNGKTTTDLERTTKGFADNIFFDGGMFPHGSWRVKDIMLDSVPLPFNKNMAKEQIFDAQEVKLPYAVGGYENRDKRIYLTKDFNVEDYTEAYLQLETLDPCGKVWLNDQLVLDADDFIKHEVCISQYLKKGNNELKILVEPRPPEVYYYWHRHDDCYNAWFCGSVSIIFTNLRRIKNIYVETLKISDKVSAEARIELESSHKGSVELFIKPSFPKIGEEVSLGTLNVDGDTIKFGFCGQFNLWSSDNPTLYEIRAVLYDENKVPIDDLIVETGFRTIEQKCGSIYLNNKKTWLRGALLMQYLPPYNEVPINHNCPSTEQIAAQALMLKNMNGNLMRLHLLGYGTNDARYARICDRLGIMLIWTTRYIDSMETLVWDEPWSERDKFATQIKEVMNYPSIIMYEGSNEYHPEDLKVIDRMYDAFTEMADSTDSSRLLSPCSALYYGAEWGCVYYNNDGTADELGNPARSGKGWVHPRVIRSTHPYSYTCGYGTSWERMRKELPPAIVPLLADKKFAILGTEYAVTALPNPLTKEAKSNPYVESYERPDEIYPIGRIFTQDEWLESQALQALCASQATKKMRQAGISGMAWCCLMSGANNGSYMKPPIDFYGYKKLGFYALKDAFRAVYASRDDLFISYGTDDTLTPQILSDSKHGRYSLKVSVLDHSGNCIDDVYYDDIEVDECEIFHSLPAFRPKWSTAGYYEIKYELTEKM